MKKLLFFASIFCFTVFVNNTVLAQYSNATLNGPWFADTIPAQIYNDDNTNYIVFDGNGNITDGSMFGTISGTYSVTPGGAISGTMMVDGTPHTFSAQFSSQNYAPMGSGMALSRITNPGALTDSLVGILYTANCGQKNVTLRLNSQGQIISALGLTSPVTGRVYADSGHFEGHIKTGEASGWDAFTILGAYAADSLIGTGGLDERDCDFEMAQLKRFGRISGIIPIAASEPALIVYPNPASDNFTLSIDIKNASDVTLTIYTSVGTLVKSELLRENNQRIYIGDLSCGVYVIALKSKDLTENRELIVQR